MNDENVEVICQSSNAREQSVSSENLSTHQIFFQPRWKLSNEIFLVGAYRNPNPVMELNKDWQRKKFRNISSCSFVTFYYINIVIKYSILSITLSSHVPSFCISSHYQMGQMINQTLKTLGLIVRLARKIDDWCRSYIQIATIVCKSGTEATSM